MFRGLDTKGHGVLLEDDMGTYKFKILDNMGAPDRIVLLSAQTVLDMAEFVEKCEETRAVSFVYVEPASVQVGERILMEFTSDVGVFRAVESEYVAAIRHDDGLLRFVNQSGKVFYNSETHAGMKIGVVR